MGWNWFLIEALWLVFGLVTVSMIDIDHYPLPDVFTLSGIVLGLTGALINPDRSFVDSLLGVLLGGEFCGRLLTSIFFFAKKKAWAEAISSCSHGSELSSVGKRFHLLLFLPASLALSAELIALRQKKGMKTVIPFGPYLALGAVIYLFHGGEHIAQWYLSLFIPGLE